MSKVRIPFGANNSLRPWLRIGGIHRHNNNNNNYTKLLWFEG
jgi:hypothetical protein